MTTVYASGSRSRGGIRSKFKFRGASAQAVTASSAIAAVLLASVFIADAIFLMSDDPHRGPCCGVRRKVCEQFDYMLLRI